MSRRTRDFESPASAIPPLRLTRRPHASTRPGQRSRQNNALARQGGQPGKKLIEAGRVADDIDAQAGFAQGGSGGLADRSHPHRSKRAAASAGSTESAMATLRGLPKGARSTSPACSACRRGASSVGVAARMR